MAVYRETDGYVIREYTLVEGEPLTQLRSKCALIELVPTREFGLCLFLDNELQFAEKDEYIYHESFVHPCLSFSSKRKKICIIGGGDGCAAREVLKWSTVRSIDVIDWDSTLTDLFRTKYADLNNQSLQDSRVHIENLSIQSCIHDERIYDCILVDLLDPDFSKEFQEDLWYDVLFCCRQWISESGCIVINLGGVLPWNTTNVQRMQALLNDRISMPYRLYKVFVPSFGREWCFALLGQILPDTLPSLPDGLHFMSHQVWDMANQWSDDFLLHLNPTHNS